MDAETVEKIAALAKQAMDRTLLTASVGLPFEGTDHKYDFRIAAGENGLNLGEAVKPFRPEALAVETLTGFVDAVRAGVAGDLSKGRVVHVEDYLTVRVLDAQPDKFGVRSSRLVAKYTPPGAFEFEKYIPAELFIIGLRTCFLFTEGDDSLWLLKVVQNLKAGETVHSKDDGINQTVTLKVGAVESAETEVKPIVKLCPIRTFNECPPSIGEYLLRLRPHPQNQLPLIALYPIGGNKWKGELMQSIKGYLGRELPDATILA